MPIETVVFLSFAALVVVLVLVAALLARWARQSREGRDRIVRVLQQHGALPGRDIARLAQVGRGAVYVHLARLEDEGVVQYVTRPTVIVGGGVVNIRIYSLKEPADLP